MFRSRFETRPRPSCLDDISTSERRGVFRPDGYSMDCRRGSRMTGSRTKSETDVSLRRRALAETVVAVQRHQGSVGMSPSATRQIHGVISGLASIISASACS